MPAIWDTHFGFVEGVTGRAVVVGEWGGRYTGADKTWQDAFASYLISRCMDDTMYWQVARVDRPTSVARIAD
jgi:endoglucanase